MTDMMTRILGGSPGPEEPWRRESTYVGDRHATNAERAAAVAGRAEWLAQVPVFIPFSYIEEAGYQAEVYDCLVAAKAYRMESARASKSR